VLLGREGRRTVCTYVWSGRRRAPAAHHPVQVPSEGRPELRPEEGAEPHFGLVSDQDSSLAAAVQGGVQGRVRSWTVWPEAGLLLLNMRDNRWCANIGRFHASNGIFYVVDLQVRLSASLAPSIDASHDAFTDNIKRV